jgi:hypothetical protein
LKIDEAQHTSADGMGTYYGQVVVDQTKDRLRANPVPDKTSVFMGSTK